jgi:hypothetical protein
LSDATDGNTVMCGVAMNDPGRVAVLRRIRGDVTTQMKVSSGVGCRGGASSNSTTASSSQLGQHLFDARNHLVRLGV